MVENTIRGYPPEAMERLPRLRRYLAQPKKMTTKYALVLSFDSKTAQEGPRCGRGVMWGAAALGLVPLRLCKVNCYRFANPAEAIRGFEAFGTRDLKN